MASLIHCRRGVSFVDLSGMHSIAGGKHRIDPDRLAARARRQDEALHVSSLVLDSAALASTWAWPGSADTNRVRKPADVCARPRPHAPPGCMTSSSPQHRSRRSGTATSYEHEARSPVTAASSAASSAAQTSSQPARIH